MPSSKLRRPSAFAESRAGEIGAAEVHGDAVDDHGFGVKARTAADGQALWKGALQFTESGRAWRAGMKQANLDAGFGQLTEDLHDGWRSACSAARNQHGLEVGRGDIDADFGSENSFENYALKMTLISDQLDGSAR